ncbi:LPS assembly protein LptD [candidate division GN15 bacterium]|nr:LPS assembly protein LptD [candidate division GN15 bacterium]
MDRRLPAWGALVAAMLLLGVAVAQQGGRLYLEHADNFEIVFDTDPETHYVSGNVIFQTGTGTIFCDSAVWRKGQDVILRGNVVIKEEDFHLQADSVSYNLEKRDAVALGSYVELWSLTDSLFATGQHAYIDRDDEFYRMEERPTMLLNYPDTANMIEVIADRIDYDTKTETAQASGDVTINSQDMSAKAGCAIMDRNEMVLDLFEDPVARRGQSVISGSLISMDMFANVLRQIDVIDSARGDFQEPLEEDSSFVDQSILTGRRLIIDFVGGEIDRITCWGQAYAWYYPSSRGRPEMSENTVSGDTIYLTAVDERLNQVEVIGGAIGTYLSGKVTQTDSVAVRVVDTIDYNAEYILYELDDSLITLVQGAHVTSGEVILDAFQIEYFTDREMIRAYSADVAADSGRDEYALRRVVQPNPIPIILKDGDEELFGNYLEYSIETEKGRIVKSKSDYETGYYYGQRVFRARKDIFYVEEGRYTTCDLEEPHFHFYSDNMKLMQNDKLIAKPVVFYLGRLPLLALPYYVFPLKKGRHSGFLPFTFGNIERGERYLRNVGYYWAASEYWDVQGALDYYERDRTINLFGKVTWNKRYAFNGNFTLNYARETNYDRTEGREFGGTRWALRGSHNHDISPSFKIAANGEYQSDATYYNDFSTDLEDRLNRNTRSEINFTKRFGSKVSLSGKVSHDVDLDAESRVDRLPTLGLSLPAWNPFGEGRVNEQGELERSWYNDIVVTYRPNFENFSSRITIDSALEAEYLIDTIPVDTTIDTLIVDDTLMQIDTVVTGGFVDSTFLSQDTLSRRSRKKYSKANHAVSVRAPLKLFRYLVFNPSLNYSETWFNLYSTDQLRDAGLEPTQYRTYSYDVGANLNTKLYGTVYPNAFGLVGLRQVISPSVSYSFRPEVDRHPEVRSYAGGGAGNTRTSSLMSMSINHVYQAKIAAGEAERNLELVSITHGFSYDFERPERPFSDLTTSFQSSVLPNIKFYGSMRHSLYKPGTDDLSFFSPYLESFEFNASVSLAGQQSIFDADLVNLQGADSAGQLNQPAPATAQPAGASGSGRGWNLSASYTFSESGLHSGIYTKRAFARLNLRFNLTPTTAVNYSHYYDFERHRTVNNQISIVKNLHCWTGSFYWVPVGSNRGYGFRLYVTALPSIKLENSESPLSSSYFQGFR